LVWIAPYCSFDGRTNSGIGWRQISIALKTHFAAQSVKWPYSWSDRRDPNIGFSQQRSLFRCVQICVFGDGVQGKGAPFPCISNGEARQYLDFASPPSTEKSTLTVRMVADEVFCRLPTMGAVGGVPWLRVLWPNTRCSKSESRTAGRALLPKRILR